MLKPKSLNAKPAESYEALKKQFNALKGYANRLQEQFVRLQNKDYEAEREKLQYSSSLLNSEREMNAILTNELETANNRIARSIEILLSGNNKLDSIEIGDELITSIAQAVGSLKDNIDQNKDRFDLASELERLTNIGYAPQVIYDDDGNFAIADEGSFSVRITKNDNFSASLSGEAQWFKPTPHQAWELYLARLRRLGNNV